MKIRPWAVRCDEKFTDNMSKCNPTGGWGTGEAGAGAPDVTGVHKVPPAPSEQFTRYCKPENTEDKALREYGTGFGVHADLEGTAEC